MNLNKRLWVTQPVYADDMFLSTSLDKSKILLLLLLFIIFTDTLMDIIKIPIIILWLCYMEQVMGVR